MYTQKAFMLKEQTLTLSSSLSPPNNNQFKKRTVQFYTCSSNLLVKKSICTHIRHESSGEYIRHNIKALKILQLKDSKFIKLLDNMNKLTCNCCVSSKPSGNSVQLVSSCCDNDVTKFRVFILVGVSISLACAHQRSNALYRKAQRLFQ